jgi:hypothetical protein
VLAAKLVGHTGDISRFPGPRPPRQLHRHRTGGASSGDVRRQRLNRDGTRQLNTALHLVDAPLVDDIVPLITSTPGVDAKDAFA